MHPSTVVQPSMAIISPITPEYSPLKMSFSGSGICDNDYTIGPGATCRGLDFTILFTNIFLAFVPALILLLSGIPRILYLFRHDRVILPWRDLPGQGKVLIAIKAVLGTLLLASQIELWVSQSGLSNQGWTEIAANASETIAAAAVLFLVILEHLKCHRPSQLPALYLIITTLFAGSRLRSTYLISGGGTQTSTSLSVCLAARFALFCALQVSARSSLIDPDVPPGAASGLVSRYFLAWVLPLLWRGYRRPIGLSDLGEIDRSLHSEATWDTFAPYWSAAQQNHKDGRSKQPLLASCARAFMGRLAAPVLPSLIYAVTSMARPLLISRTVLFAQSYATADPQPLAEGWGLVGAGFLVYTVFALSTALAHVANQRAALSIRGALMEVLYRKSLLIRVETAREMGSAKAVNLMSVDVDNIVRTMDSIHDTWTAFVLTGLGLYIIYTQIGISFISSVIGAIIFFAMLPPLSQKVGPTRTGWADATDRRIKFMSSVLRHIKAIKLSAYEIPISKVAEKLRWEEISAQVKWIKQVLLISTLTNYLGNFLCLITLATFTIVEVLRDGGQSVTTARVFTVVATIELISAPLLELGQRLGSIVTAWAGFKRIEEFLLTEERVAPKADSEYEAEGLDDEMIDLPKFVRPVERRIQLNNAEYGVTGKAILLKELNVDQGKSSLLQALLSELDLLSGEASVHLGTVGYCSQDPWLRINASIRENIVFMHPFDDMWYRRVIKSTALDVDLGVMSQGDQTLVSSLSGGQRQRVALARAIYGQFDSLILDDVFSALDADTEARVFAALFGPKGVLNSTSVILATNQIYRLPYASYVSILDAGRIAEQGSYDDLRSEGGMLSQLILEFAAGAESRKSEVRSGRQGRKQDHQGSSSEISRAISDVESSILPAVPGLDPADGLRSNGAEESAKGKVKWPTYLLYLQGMGYVHSVFWVAFVVLAAIVQLTIGIYLQAWTSSLTAGSPPSKYARFLGGYAGMQLGFLFAFTVAVINAFVYAHPIASRKLHNWMLRSVMRTALDWFESRPSGQVINRFNSDLNMRELHSSSPEVATENAVDMTLPNHIVNVIFVLTLVLGSAVIIMVAGPIMIAVIAGTVITCVLLQRFYVRAGRELRRLDLTTRSPIYQLFSETIDPDGLRTIRAMRAEDMCRAMMTERATGSQYPAWLLVAIQRWLQLSLNVCVMAINTLLILLAVVNRNGTSAGLLAVAMTQAATLNISIGQLVVEWTNVEMCITSIERLQEYIRLPPQIETADPSFRPPKAWPNRGAIRFSNVSARYAPHLPPALNNLSLVIKPGQRVGICGRSGSGKSTLLGVLWRLIPLEPESEILVDGVDIEDVSMAQHRDSLSIIPQDPLLLELTLRENLDLVGKHSDADIWDALNLAQLRAHCEALPEKLDTLISSDSGQFSRGQRQLLALARAVLRQRPVLALDEATSSIDAQTDAAIQTTIRESFADTTILTIAHRIATIVDYDVVVVMEAGRVVEVGEPSMLLRREGGRFRGLAMESGISVD